MIPDGFKEVAEGIFFRKGKKSSPKKNKVEVDKYHKHEAAIQKAVKNAIGACITSEFHDTLSKLFDDVTSPNAMVKAAYFSSEGFQPQKLESYLEEVSPKGKRNLKFYDVQPPLIDLIQAVEKDSKVPFVAIFDISSEYNKSFYQKFVDLMKEG